MIIRALPRTFLLNLSALGVMGFTLLACMVVAMAADESPPGETAAKASDCFSCHSIDQKLVGPAFTAVAQKFAGQPGAASTLEAAIKNGHVGTWGQIPMPAHPQLSDAQLQQIVAWILTLKAPKSAATAAPGPDLHHHGQRQAGHHQLPDLSARHTESHATGVPWL